MVFFQWKLLSERHFCAPCYVSEMGQWPELTFHALSDNLVDAVESAWT